MNGILLLNWVIMLLSIYNLILLSDSSSISHVADPTVCHPAHF